MSATRPTGPTEPNRLKLSVEGFRLTLRTRLALTYAGLLTLAGALMMLIVYVVVGYLPTYAFAVPADHGGTPADHPDRTALRHRHRSGRDHPRPDRLLAQ